jgi:hypothetical protein
MKIIKKYLILLISGLFVSGCDKPAVTELIPDEEENEPQIEIITEDPLLNTGFDSTGYVGYLTSYTNVVILSGIKKSFNETTITENSTAQAIFFDRRREVKDTKGKTIGFATLTPGSVQIDNSPAGIFPLKIRYRVDQGVKDTILGNQYLMVRNRFTFRYNSAINFDFNPFQEQNNINFDIATPPEINPAVRKEGSIREGTLKVFLEWDKDPNPLSELEIIVGGYLSKIRAKIHIPIYRLRITDSGRLNVPADLLRKLPDDSFDSLTFTFIRKYEHAVPGQENFISIAQCIHSTGIIP